MWFDLGKVSMERALVRALEWGVMWDVRGGRLGYESVGLMCRYGL